MVTHVARKRPPPSNTGRSTITAPDGSIGLPKESPEKRAIKETYGQKMKRLVEERRTKAVGSNKKAKKKAAPKKKAAKKKPAKKKAAKKKAAPKKKAARKKAAKKAAKRKPAKKGAKRK